MGKFRRKRAAADREGDAGFMTGGALDRVSMARRSFLGRIGRRSAAIALFGLGAEAWMQTVSKQSMLASAVAAGATRDRQLHPFPADDPYNMPLGVNTWYAPADDPATKDFTARGMAITVNNGWSHPVFFPTTTDRIHTFRHSRGDNCWWLACRVESYLEEEHGEKTLSEHLQEGADTKSNTEDFSGFYDDHLHIIIGNDLVELYRFRTPVDYEAVVSRAVRNRLDHYSFSRYAFSNPLANTAGTRAWGGCGLAGLIRKHEVETANPYIPHAMAMAGRMAGQMGATGDGDPSSPLYNVRQMFPANDHDFGGYDGDGNRGNGTGNWRMGMRFALDPTICTDAWIDANAPNMYVRAFAYALRDYGAIVADGTDSSNTFYGEEGIASSIENALFELDWMRPYVRRVAGAGLLHNPRESDWEAWRANGQGWGGGAPRVPYSDPLTAL